MTISRDDVVHVAQLARLELTDEEIETFTVQLGTILEHADTARTLDTEGVPPTAHPVQIAHALREDDPRPSLPRDVVLAQAPASEDGQISVPRILDEA